MEHNGLLALWAELVEEARVLLPENAKYGGTSQTKEGNTVLQFFSRKDGGVTLHRTCVPLLTLLRKGFTEHAYERVKVVSGKASDGEVQWHQWYGLYAAPDGTFVRASTYKAGDVYEDGPGDQLLAYGVINDGKFEQYLGRRWAGSTPDFSLWKCAAAPLVVQGSDVRFDPRSQFTDFYLPYSVAGFADVRAVADSLNKRFDKRIYNQGQLPSPDYYDESRWTRDGSTWSFV